MPLLQFHMPTPFTPGSESSPALIGPSAFTSSYTASMYGRLSFDHDFIDDHMRSELATIVQRSSGYISTGRSDASWHQNSNSSPAAAMRDSSVRSCTPRRANRGSSCERTRTLTESICRKPIRSRTRRTWRRSTRPAGRLSPKPWACSAIRRAWARERDSLTGIGGTVRAAP